MSVGVVGSVERPNVSVSTEAFAIASICTDIVLAFAGALAGAWFAVLTGAAATANPVQHLRTMGLAVLIYALLKGATCAYTLRRGHAPPLSDFRVVSAWNAAFIVAILVEVFVLQMAWLPRRLFFSYLGGLAGVLVGQSLFYAVGQYLNRNGFLARGRRLSGDRVLIVGTKNKLEEWGHALATSTADFNVCEIREIPGGDNAEKDPALLDEELNQALRCARTLNVNVILLLAPWSQRSVIERCVATFSNLPATLHLAPDVVLKEFANLGISTLGNARTFSLVRPPLKDIDAHIKRAFDVVVAGTALVLLAPLLLVVALAIKIDSAGPILFRQRRYGFNQGTFYILKFRTMRTQEDGDVIVQAAAGDCRITRLGAWLRRTSIDELPQLINVLKGEMSIVGPRPHAVAHNREYEGQIANYARRHNVRPGITGWAQVNGLRGRTEALDIKQRRIDYDLYYIDNWSFSFDVFIVACTLLTPRVFLNAY
jgi:Undecaprenyl-phosphate glucose phosphotransferase